MLCTHFWVAQDVERRVWRGERWLQELEDFNKKDWDQCHMGKVGGVAISGWLFKGYEKGQCLEDHHQRLEQIWKVSSWPRGRSLYSNKPFLKHEGHQEGCNDSWRVSQKNPSSSA